ncbi:hypothetical protein Pan258_44900 [Symmachiella dynata]|uniref:ATP-binding protein n=1 Tax=Symmachiella dynata TaxID=2527995 RepID=UPI00118AF131|nr:ATP-binding protein [Symmachiella dynata]QDT50431.1 hypothetical protein Pan258_44900 [Symmachiella dynata]
MSTISDTSGQAHPYWYEWFVGLIEVVKLLNPDEEIETVAFQVSSIQGWDDVVVAHANGKRLYQVKHTREQNNLTFGSLVEVDGNGNSLLGSLFEGAKNSGLIDPKNELVLYTNREDGSRWSKRGNGDRRPPLLEFWSWLKSELEAKELAEIKVPRVDDDKLDYSAAWAEWVACFNGDEKEATRFLKQLTIRTKEDDRVGLESRIRESLATAFGITVIQTAPLFDALCRELRLWTTGHSGVTVEALCDALTIAPAPKEFAPAPPPPSPFFPTRLPVAEQLQTDLLDDNESPVVFLTGEPGSGKTSAVSWLANRRTEDAFQGIIGIRFFCFEPIRPEQPFISPDASRVKPKELWESLLTQLRRGLKGRLHELKVPLRNEFLTWAEAREHVLRLSDILGQELSRKFVISIDGIDHAARASQVIPEQIAEFFDSLPSPDEVGNKQIRLLIAGQPPEYYAKEYPTWLTIHNDKVRRIDLPKLEHEDIRSLLEESQTTIGDELINEAVRLIDKLSQGNTLSVVFAVAEAEICESLEELRDRLNERLLGDGLSKYYGCIWNHALRESRELSCSLSGVISLARTPVTANQLSTIFSSSQKPAPWWNQVLTDLGPLLTRHGDGFLIRHNDIRVFLVSMFKSFGEEDQKAIASQLVDYFSSKDADRLTAHLQLFPLLHLADRSVQAASLFDVDWVLEGAALGLDGSILLREGELAISELSNSKTWSNVVTVSCALDTLDRVSEFIEHYVKIEPWKEDLPPFLPTEANVRALAQWTKDDFHQLIWDAHELFEGGGHERAHGLLGRWLSGLGINQLIQTVPGFEADQVHSFHDDEEPHLDERVARDFETLGRLSAKLGWPFWGELSRTSPRMETDAFYSFEKGFVDEITTVPHARSADELFAQHEVRFFTNHELAVRNLARAGLWSLVAECLQSMEEQRDSYSDAFRLEASWYALRSAIPAESSWIIAPNELKGYMPSVPKHDLGDDINLSQFIYSAMAIGWTNPGLDTGDIAEHVLESFELPDEVNVVNAMKLLFRTAAVVGRFESHFTQSNRVSAATLFTPNYIQQLLSALWGDVINRAGYRFNGRTEASAFAERLVQICEELGGEFDAAALEAALPFANKFALGIRLNPIWNVVKRHGKLEVLRNWLNKYISEEGTAWTWSPESARETVSDLVPLARSIGMDDLANYAERRASTLVVGYLNHKEYSFERVNDWFLEAAKNEPAIWSAQGWQLWELCRICHEKDGDNRLESGILKGISAAAICAGKTTSWWRLVSTTLPKKCERGWHSRISHQFVSGYTEALAQGLSIDDDEILQIWSIALSLSYWFESGDTLALLELRAALLSGVSPERKSEIEGAMQSVSPMVSDTRNGEGAEMRSPTVHAVPEGPRDEDAWWDEVDHFLHSKDDEEEYRYVGYASGLMSIAQRRARLHGNDELLAGLNIQLKMHMRWAFGGETLDSISIPDLPVLELGSTDDVFVELLKVLLETYSVEVTVAALEGLHNYVAYNPAIIPRLLDEISNEWPQRWLLNAAESWAVLHPNDVHNAKATLNTVMESADFDCRLQAWIVLTRNTQTLEVDPPDFPLPEEPQLSMDEVEAVGSHLLEIPPNVQGSTRLANKFSTVHMLLEYCEHFGFQFERIRGLIASELIKETDMGGSDLQIRGPHRYADSTYNSAEAEKAFGNAVSSIVSSDWCGHTELAELSQATLPNEDAWIHRTRPSAIRCFQDWPAVSEYGSEEIDNATRKQQMLNAAKCASVDDKWTVFVARVGDFTSNKDFDLYFWFEGAADSTLISAPKVPKCPGGRSFMWWVGEPRDPSSQFVSGRFVGGHHRLPHCHFKIRPPLNWRDEFGWTPNPLNALEWLFDGKVVAKYERVHGVLRDAPHGPKHRQPIIDRWVITNAAFAAVKAKFPDLRERDAFEVFKFNE